MNTSHSGGESFPSAMIRRGTLTRLFSRKGKSQKASVAVNVICRATNEGYELTFKLSDSIPVVKERIKTLYRRSGGDDINLLFGGNILNDGQTLQSIFRRGGMVAEPIEVFFPDDNAAVMATAAVVAASSNLPAGLPRELDLTPSYDSDESSLGPFSVRKREVNRHTRKARSTRSNHHLRKSRSARSKSPTRKPLSEALDEYEALQMLRSMSLTGLIHPGVARIADAVFGETDDAKVAPTPDKLVDSFDTSETERVITCPSCQDDFPESETIAFLCSLDQEVDGQDHCLCVECAKMYVNSAKTQDPRIKCFHHGCEHFLLPQEIALVLGEGNVETGMKDPTYHEIDLLRRDYVINHDPQDFARCPCEGCEWVVARSSRKAVEKASCPTCGLDFCTGCGESYHYRTTCAEWREFKLAWQSWKRTGRTQYWKGGKKMTRAERVAAEKEKKRVEKVRETEAQDEQYKAEKCRHCPNCNRLVEKMEGCNIMRCGYDTDTKKNQQDGCGERFTWTEAQAYVPVKAGVNVKFHSPTPSTIPTREKKLHPGERCDQCGKQEVRGLLFRCVNCPSYILCEECDKSSTRNGHGQNHVFAIET